MPASYRIDLVRRMVFSTFSGVVIDAELIMIQAQIRVDPAFDPRFGHLADLSAVEEFAVREVTMRYLSAAPLFRPDAPRAIVATMETTYTLTRLFQQLNEAAGNTVRVFQDREAALTWLEHSSEPPEPKKERTV